MWISPFLFCFASFRGRYSSAATIRVSDSAPIISEVNVVTILSLGIFSLLFRSGLVDKIDRTERCGGKNE